MEREAKPVVIGHADYLEDAARADVRSWGISEIGRIPEWESAG